MLKKTDSTTSFATVSSSISSVRHEQSTKIDLLINRFLIISSHPQLTGLFLNAFQDLATGPQASLFPHLPRIYAVMLTRYGFTEHAVEALLEENLSLISQPSLILRDDSIGTKILKEFPNSLIGNALYETVGPQIRSLGTQKLTTAQLCKKAMKILSAVYESSLPYQFRSFLQKVSQIVGRKFPGSERIGLVSVFFLRYFCPMLIRAPEFFPIPNATPCYQENSVKVSKLIQALANGNIPTSELEAERKFYSPFNQQVMATFIDSLGTFTPLDRSLTTMQISDSDIFTFCSLISTSTFRIRQALRKLPEKEYLPFQSLTELLAEWTNLSGEIVQMQTTLKDRIEMPDHITPTPIPEVVPFAEEASSRFLGAKPRGAFSFGRKKSVSSTSMTSLSAVIESGRIAPSRSLSPTRSFPRDDSSSDLLLEGDSLSCSSNEALGDRNSNRVQHLIDHLALKQVLKTTLSPEITRLFPSKQEICSWSEEKVSQWLEANSLGDFTPAFATINGDALYYGRFELPSDTKLGHRKCFEANLSSLKRHALDIFEDSAFSSKESQIQTLKEALAKISLVALMLEEECHKLESSS